MITELTTENLKKTFQELHQSVYINECYGARDIQSMLAIEEELGKRGVTVEVKKRVVFCDGRPEG